MTGRKFNILMCCHLPLRPTLGGAKVYIEAAEAYKLHGHNVKLIGIDEIVGKDAPFMDEFWRVKNYPELLAKYLNQHGGEYDVVEYESIYLPLKLDDSLKCLRVARSVLLDLHLREIQIPRFKGLRSFVGLLLKSKERKRKLNIKIEQSVKTMMLADFVNVPNPSDKNILIRYGIAEEKIIVHPYGIFEKKYQQFQGLNKEKVINSKPKIAFIGTFDNRKGAVEFPQIISELTKRFPDLEFKLLGVLGMFPDEESIYKYLGEDLRSKVYIQEKYSPDDLPELLSDCSIGIFPSYLESFGFGVLEMMAMDFPVVGYDSPGINMLLLKELTVSPGRVNEMVQIFSKLISDKTFHHACVLKTREKVSGFIYETQVNNSLIYYLQKIEGLRG